MAAPFSQTTRALAGERRHGLHAAAALAGVGLAAWIAWGLTSRVTLYEVSQEAHLQVVRPPYHLDGLVTSTVLSSSLSLGRFVRAGDLLLELDASEERLNLAEEQSRQQSLKTRLAALEREIAARQTARDELTRSAESGAVSARHREDEARIAADFARDTEKRLGELAAKGGISRSEASRAAAETARLTAVAEALRADVDRLLQEARGRAAEAAAEIESLRNTASALEGERQLSATTIERLQRDLAKYVIVAPIDGVIGDVAPLKAGTYVKAGDRLATIVPEGQMKVVADFNPSATLGRVHAGQTARLRLDSYPWAQYGTVTARVAGIGSEIHDGRVTVDFDLVSVPTTGIVLQHGLPGSIEVAVEETSPAVLLLRSAGLLVMPEAAAREGN